MLPGVDTEDIENHQATEVETNILGMHLPKQIAPQTPRCFVGSSPYPFILHIGVTSVKCIPIFY
jgi:hypothetical protein